MDKREKTDFILEQVELCIEKGDWTQAGILSRKISTKYLKSSDDVSDLKLKFYQQQIILAVHDSKFLDACKHYRDVYDTKEVVDDEFKLRATLERIVYYVILAPYDNEQHDLLHRIEADPRLPLVAKTQYDLLKAFTKQELMRWPLISESYGAVLRASDVFDASKEGEERWEELRKRVIEHNLRVIAKYYTRIRMERLCGLLDLGQDETEKYLSQLVTQKTIYARIDRPARVVSFAQPRDADDILNEWSGNFKSLLGLLERIDHLITRVSLVYSFRYKRPILTSNAGGNDGQYSAKTEGEGIDFLGTVCWALGIPQIYFLLVRNLSTIRCPRLSPELVMSGIELRSRHSCALCFIVKYYHVDYYVQMGLNS